MRKHRPFSQKLLDMKKIVFILTLALVAALPLSAQVDNDSWLIDDSWLDQDDYNTFKQQSEKKFNDFRDSANAIFARELARQWQPVPLQKPVERPHKPQPKVAPVAPKPQKQHKPTPALEKMPEPEMVVPAPVIPAPVKRVLPMPEIPANPDEASFNFYEKELVLWIPKKSDVSSCTLASTKEKDVSRMWKTLCKADVQSCINQLLAQQKTLKVNDWGMYELASSLAANLFPDNNRRVIATVFLLNQMEYDAKIARTDNGLACLLAIDCMVYANPYVNFGNKKYFLFMPDNAQKDYRGDVHTYSCSLKGSNLRFDMAVSSSPAIPLTKYSKDYERSVDTNRAVVPVNENLMDYYKNYPQVDISIYANAQPDSLFRSAVDKWFRPMVKGKTIYDAVSTLLSFMQFGFDYATDQEQFGYEKPFFCEENFYYPKNDCEDRSILLSFLVRYLLNLDVVLVEYQGHLATAVLFPKGDVNGDYYKVDGKKYVVCDPTYIGADIGMVQPDYKKVSAKIIKLSPLH